MAPVVIAILVAVSLTVVTAVLLTTAMMTAAPIVIAAATMAADVAIIVIVPATTIITAAAIVVPVENIGEKIERDHKVVVVPAIIRTVIARIVKIVCSDPARMAAVSHLAPIAARQSANDIDVSPARNHVDYIIVPARPIADVEVCGDARFRCSAIITVIGERCLRCGHCRAGR
jgi:hypothetical protein